LPAPAIYKPLVAATEVNRTYLRQAIAYGDVIGDSTKDLMIVHTRSTDANALVSTDWSGTGRFAQLLQLQSGVWVDVSAEYLGD